MGFISDIVRDSRRPPPAVKRVPFGAAPQHRRGGTVESPAQRRRLGPEAMLPPSARTPFDPFGPAAEEPTDGQTNDGPADARSISAGTRQSAEPLPVKPTRAAKAEQPGDETITRSKPLSVVPADRRATTQTSLVPAGSPKEAVATAKVPAKPEDAGQGVSSVDLQAQHVREVPGAAPDVRSAEKAFPAEPAVPTEPSRQTRHPLTASPIPDDSIGAMDKDGSARAKAIPKRPQGKVPSPVHTDFQGTPWSKMPPLVRATTAPKESDIPSPVAPSDDAAGKPPVAAKSVPFNPAPSPVLPEAGDESGPTPESRVAVAQPAAPIQLEVPTVPALVRHQEEDRTDGNQRQPELRQAAIAEGPKVQIGLLEVVVLAPDRGSHETPPAANARSNFASRHYLRNV